MKRLLWLGLAIALCAGDAFPVDFTALKPEGYVSDFAKVLDPASKARLEQYCAAVEKATGAEIAIVTLPTLQGEPIEDVANALFRKWGVGKKGTNEGVLLLLVINDRRSRLEVGYGLEPNIPDGFAGSILRSMRPYLRDGQYGAALEVAATDIGSTIAKAKGVTLNAQPPQRTRERRTEARVPWPVILFGGFFLLLFLARIFGGRGGPRGRGFGGGGPGDLLTGMVIGNLFGRDWGGRVGGGGGGFGGFDGGGFGGFGGGDSGGGGASSDW